MIDSDLSWLVPLEAGALPKVVTHSNQQNIPGPPSQQDNPHEPDQPQARAAGGRVEARNINHTPTEAQRHSGNYSKDHVSVQGLNITIENAKGSNRSGIGKDGKPWTCKLQAHYGYLRRSEARDQDHIDVYLGPHIKSPHVFVIDQIDAETGNYDEAKVGIGFSSKEQYLNVYNRCFSDGKGLKRVGAITALSMPQFKTWLQNGNTKAPFAKPNLDPRITRAAFLYLPSKQPDFAMCSTCAAFNRETKYCSPIGTVVEKTWSCGLYVPGAWDGSKPAKRVSAKDAGLVKTQVRCENCEYGGKRCGLYEKLNKTLPKVFALETEIEPKACCNAFTAKTLN